MEGVTGINHVTFAVRDVEESFRFYTTTLGFRPLARWPTGAYLLAGTLWVALVADEKTRSQPLPEYSHVAFSVPPEHFASFADRLRAAGVKTWQENQTEGDSLYFLDPNGHKLEIHATDWEARLRSARADPWEGLQVF